MPSGNLHKGPIGLSMLAVSKVQHSRLFSFIKLEVLRIDLRVSFGICLLKMYFAVVDFSLQAQLPVYMRHLFSWSPCLI